MTLAIPLHYRMRCALLHRIRRALRALNTGRLTGATFDRLLDRWKAVEQRTDAMRVDHWLASLTE